MIGVFIVPTGVGAKIGGDAGDASPALKLIANCCDMIITHPNVVNASDISEMPENCLYVEGSQLDTFLAGEANLEETYGNKILVIANSPVKPDTYNAVNAAKHTLGAKVDVLGLSTPLRMIAHFDQDGRATGTVSGVKEACAEIYKYETENGIRYDAIAVHTPIGCDRGVQIDYFKNGGVNPWGGVEAKASKELAQFLKRPIAHAPIESIPPEDTELWNIHTNKVVIPRGAAEAISCCYLHCVIKGLHKAPKLTRDYSGIRAEAHIDFMMSPNGVWGPAHYSCHKHDIPIIIVKENTTIYDESPPEGINVIFVDNYIEAAGMIMLMKAGLDPTSVRA